jgi:hypothetical protein
MPFAIDVNRMKYLLNVLLMADDDDAGGNAK